jgi:hypothetical protein
VPPFNGQKSVRRKTPRLAADHKDREAEGINKLKNASFWQHQRTSQRYNLNDIIK